ncbi:hypothetical protein KL933_003118 [Ogataea haglerorum]|uniref:t-SNARE coiled-coil homology domain-containing protein n=1 Tax=Ogataea haglerorum TaxID=1937702 RepID=A0AAN6D4L6_9ASCO|nr:uncharacterized protein KL911_000679 [Ogataea haglerorum]KAG7693439.1 hypothetical protein KL951_004460 [Ogataea haglerorum]KAG7726835.1 hypothetical protein KL933_003118 [Ogataea haglerorum]KAG7733273.1 hypothetical protein KL948_001776 [Ogataea haglerorum]KAG7750272.1 hypothetical protein KL912_000832 [Ogataea haglerorum]KAG7757703.1 hypothetical protein KL911_000679 [Ogataea haglerorum]
MAALERQFTKLALLEAELGALVEDFHTLKQVGDAPVLNSNDDLMLAFSKLANLIKYMELLLVEKIDSSGAGPEVDRFREGVEVYNRHLNSIKEDIPKDVNLEISTIRLDEAVNRPRPKIKKSKSVRFKENLIDPSESQKREQAASSSPSKDEPNKDSLFETNTVYKDDGRSTIDPLRMSNKQIFMENQQEIINQDDIINSLSQSVNRQHEMSLQIGEEVGNHMVLLDDLESGISRTNAKIIRGRSNIDRFRQNLKEHGDWFTIFVLVIIMFILLVVLK